MKGMPQVCLSASDTRVEFNIGGKDKASNGFVATLQKVTPGNIYQQWKFNPDATISSVVSSMSKASNEKHMSTKKKEGYFRKSDMQYCKWIMKS